MTSAPNIIINNLILEHCNKSITTTFTSGLIYIQGNNGAGKSILMDYIGHIRKIHPNVIRGNDSVIYINQTDFFSPKLSGRDLLEFVYGVDGITLSYENFTHQYSEYISESLLKTMMSKPWGSLSGGERKFLYIIILLSLNREWYILDEPFANLDNSKKTSLWNIIDKKLHNGNGIIISSHEYSELLIKKSTATLCI